MGGGECPRQGKGGGDVVGECLKVREVLGGLEHWGVKVRGGGVVARDEVYGEVVQDFFNGSKVSLGLC